MTAMPVLQRSRPLFEKFVPLARSFPLVDLAELPTPVRRLERLGLEIGVPSLWLKDDGPSSPHYGGNKVRKLELVLAAAQARQARTVLTFGYAGSNHATATAVHAARLGLGSISILLPQHNAAYVRRNLLVSAAAGAELHEYPTRTALVAGAALTMLRRRVAEGRAPFVIAPGGSSPLGTIGFVNAAFELAAQAEAGLVEMPQRIYAAAGSLGTVVGLGIGLRALGASTRVVAVRVVDEQFVNASRAARLWRDTVAVLRGKDPSFPDMGAVEDTLELRSEFFGGLYARPTEASKHARERMQAIEGLSLDITYTAKALACLIEDARGGHLTGGPVLFWNTCNTSGLDELAARAGAADLPPRLRRYFAESAGGAD